MRCSRPTISFFSDGGLGPATRSIPKAAVELRPDLVLAKKLRLLRPLGQGGMGIVWAAHHLSLDTEVAVKVIRPEKVLGNPSALARFEREARATARIAHPHVVRIMDYGMVDAEVPFIVMELLRGFSLAELLEGGGRFSFSTAKRLVEQVGGALEAAHELGIVHRDIKPQNLFITEGSNGYPLFVKVVDFGVAKMVQAPEAPSNSGALTETGVVIGSAPYMSPEQLEGRKDVDLRSDLWSLAVILYEALTGVQPFQGSSFVAVGAAALRGTFRPVCDLRVDLPDAVEDWFAKALAVDPNGRFQSARELVQAFVQMEIPAAPVDEPSAAPHVQRALTFPTEAHVPAAKRPPPPVVVPKAEAVRRSVIGWRPIGAIVGGAALLIVLALGAVSRGRQPSSTACPRGMALIKGARFAMGAVAEADTPSDETSTGAAPNLPAVGAFCLDNTEVTAAAYASCKTCLPARLTVDFEGLTPNGRVFESQFCNGSARREHPMNCVDWYQATAFCAHLGKRLPTEAEWELAARGPGLRVFPWGDAPPSADRLNACGPECARMLAAKMEVVRKGTWQGPPAPLPTMYAEEDFAEATAPVGRFPGGATPEGVLDLAGNVWEWTESAYCPYPYEDKPRCGDSRRVLRGGGWDTTEAQSVRATRRYPSAPAARGKSIGFRCAKSL